MMVFKAILLISIIILFQNYGYNTD